eukprot:m51a1_g5942 hypothetical protein (301) ;mRNA; f:120139-121178
MRVVRQKKARKAITFYRMNYRMEEPYRVLVDPLLLRVAVEKKILLREHLPKVLQGRAYPCLTKCCFAWMKSQGGDDYDGASLVAKRMERVDCGHTPSLSPDECIRSMLEPQTRGELHATGHKYCVAVQGRKLRDTVSQTIAGVPVVSFLLRPAAGSQDTDPVARATALALLPPSDFCVADSERRLAARLGYTAPAGSTSGASFKTKKEQKKEKGEQGGAGKAKKAKAKAKPKPKAKPKAKKTVAPAKESKKRAREETQDKAAKPAAAQDKPPADPAGAEARPPAKKRARGHKKNTKTTAQ